MGSLYVVATPIGNLGDLSPRAAEILRTVPLVAAEDTRVTKKLLNHIESRARLTSFHENSPPQRIEELLAHLDGADLAMVTDAGSPGISDPGAALVSRAAEAGHTVVTIPGPSSVIAALSVSGFAGDRFLFLGFPPRKSAERRQLFLEHASFTAPIVLFESPHRVTETLTDLAAALPGRRVAICRELTKLHEEVFHGTTEEAAARFGEPRGEFVIVIGPGEAVSEAASDERVREAISAHRERGLKGRTLVEAVIAETGAPRSRVYPMTLAGDSR
jgi:16S rRNA (cytidine1402-2'-O)-methyltransferase